MHLSVRGSLVHSNPTRTEINSFYESHIQYYGNIQRLCISVKSKLIKPNPVNTNPTVHTPACFMTLLKANTVNLRAIKSESFMGAWRRIYTQKDQIPHRCPQTRALAHSRSYTRKHAILCWCDKIWTFCTGRSSRGCQDTGQTTPSHCMHCRQHSEHCGLKSSWNQNWQF